MSILTFRELTALGTAEQPIRIEPAIEVGNTTGNGGNLDLIAGAGGSDSQGGNVNLTAGSAGGGNAIDLHHNRDNDSDVA